MSFEKLRVYQAAQELRAEVDRLAASVAPRFAHLFRHIDEGVDSIMNNIAEGSDSIHVGKRINYYDNAIGSAKEVRSGLRSIDRRGGFNGASVFRPIVLTLAIPKMLKTMIQRLKEGKQ